LTPPAAPPPTRSERVAAFLGSSAIVGATAVLALILSLGQLAWPLVSGLWSKYSVEFESPDLINVFCAGSEGIDAAGPPVQCDGTASVVLLATPLFYKNEGGTDKRVWLRRELVEVSFVDPAEREIRKIVLAWERTAEAENFHSPNVLQIDPDHGVSHSTLFYPESYGCADTVRPRDCLSANSYRFRDFADQIISRNITHAILTFKPLVEGPTISIEQKCHWDFTEDVGNTLKKWRDQVDLVKKANPQKLPPDSIDPPYLSFNCSPIGSKHS
jgi:hypothetical protein